MVNTVKQAKRDYIWNTAAGLLNAAEAVVMSMIVTRVTGLADAGMLTIAFAVGNLMMSIGKFGIRNYQVTDIEAKFSFAVYLKTRILTVAAMVLSLVGYLCYAAVMLEYDANKIGIIFLIGMIYVIESIEDVIWGYYQGRNRLDAGAKMFCFRWIGILAVFPVVLCISRNLQFTLLICLSISFVCFFICLKVSYPKICREEERIIRWRTEREEMSAVKRLLVIALPLFGITFLSFYVNNAPKYAIDACLTDEIQACYGFVAMPVFIIGLLNNFVYQPTLVPMSIEWERKKYGQFLRRILRQFLVIALIMTVCLLGAVTLGIPVLSWLYHTDLSDYWMELLILLTAGGFLAVSGYLSVVLTIMRRQKDLLWPYCLTSLIAFLILKPVVSEYGTTGAALCYMILMVLLCILYGIILVIRWKQIKRNDLL